MIETYSILADRIEKELNEIVRVVGRAERAIAIASQSSEGQDLFVDAAALNLHDFFGGVERIFQQIGTTVDGELPAGPDWHRQLMDQMQQDMPDLRPPVLSTGVINTLDEFRRFRHVVRNIYAFEFDPEQIERLVRKMSVVFDQVRTELLVFVSFLRQVGGNDKD